MNIVKYLDFDSSYRNISVYSNPSGFEIPLTQLSYTGNSVSQQQLVDHEIALDYLILPNVPLFSQSFQFQSFIGSNTLINGQVVVAITALSAPPSAGVIIGYSAPNTTYTFFARDVTSTGFNLSATLSGSAVSTTGGTSTFYNLGLSVPSYYILTTPPTLTSVSIVSYPYVYVELQNAVSGTYNIIYSNNPHAKRMLFKAIIDDFGQIDNTPFIKLKSFMTQTLKFKPNDNLKFGVYLPDGTPFKTVQQDGVVTSVITPGTLAVSSSLTAGAKIVLTGNPIITPLASNPFSNYIDGKTYVVLTTGTSITLVDLTGSPLVVNASGTIKGLSFYDPTIQISALFSIKRLDTVIFK